MKRVRASTKNPKQFVAQPRDHQLLKALYEAKLATRDQLAELGSFGSISRVNRRLRQYVDVGLVACRPADWPHGPQSVYWLMPEAAPLLSRVLDMPARSIRREVNRTVSRTMTEHTLKIGDVHLMFRQAAQRQGLHLVRWLPERASHHRFLTRPPGTSAWRSVWVKPDAAAILDVGEDRRHIFIEVDLDSVSPAKLRQKLASYELYRCTAFREVYMSESFIVAFVTTDAARAASIVRLAGEARTIPTLVTTFDAIEAAGPLDEVWQTNQSFDDQASPLDPRLWPQSEGPR